MSESNNSLQSSVDPMDLEIFGPDASYKIKFKGSSIKGLHKDDTNSINQIYNLREKKEVEKINESNKKKKEVINKNNISDNPSEVEKDIKKPCILFGHDNKIGEKKINDKQTIYLKKYKEDVFSFTSDIKDASDDNVEISQDYMLVFGDGSYCNSNNIEDYKILSVGKNKFILLDNNNKPVKIKHKMYIANCNTKQIDKEFIKSIAENEPGGVAEFFKNNPDLLKNEAIKKIIKEDYPGEYKKIKKWKNKHRNSNEYDSNELSSISRERSSDTLTNTTSRTKDSNNDKHKPYNDKRSSRYKKPKDNQYQYYYQNQQSPMPVNGYGLDYGQQMYPIDNVGNVIGIDGLGEVDLNRPMELSIQEPEKLNCFIKTKVQMQKNTYVLYIAGVISTGAGALIFGLATSIPIAVPIALAAAGLISIVANVAINASRETQNRENEIRARRKNKILQYEFLNNNKSQAITANKNVNIPVQPIYVVPQNMIPLQNINTLQPQPQPQK